MSKRFTEGILGDGVAILDNGRPITITEILNKLNKLDQIEQITQTNEAPNEIRKHITAFFEFHNPTNKGYDGIQALIDQYLEA